MSNDLTTSTYEELNALLDKLIKLRPNLVHDAEYNGGAMELLNLDHRMSQVRAQLAKKKPAKSEKPDAKPRDVQAKLF